MEETRLIFSNYDEEDGISYVKIQTNIGHFEGYAYLNEEDKEYASKFFGCKIAEYRAIIEYLKERIFRTNLELNELKKLDEYMPMNIKTYEYLKKRINQKENYKKQCKEDIRSLRKHINSSIEERFKFLEERKEKENK